MVTIYDISKITGYSTSTISRALSGTGSISEETRERILRAAEITGFSVNQTVAVAEKRSRLIAVIVENESFTDGLEHPLFGGILSSFRELAEKEGYGLLYLSKRLNPGISYIEQCQKNNVEGVLILNSIYEDPEVNQLTETGIPCVSSNEFIPGVCTVVSENTAASRKGVEYLIEKGHRKIGYLGGPFQIKSPASIERCEGYKQALKSAGIKYDANRIEKAEYWELECGIKSAKVLFDRCPDLTAVFCASDTIAAGVIRYLGTIGKKCPEDVSILGFDDSLISSCFVPAISTFRQNKQEIAITCAGKLLEAIRGNRGYEIVRIPVEFIERDSCRAIEPVEDSSGEGSK